jgi:hypothetical protein
MVKDHLIGVLDGAFALAAGEYKNRKDCHKQDNASFPHNDHTSSLPVFFPVFVALGDIDSIVF